MKLLTWRCYFVAKMTHWQQVSLQFVFFHIISLHFSCGCCNCEKSTVCNYKILAVCTNQIKYSIYEITCFFNIWGNFSKWMQHLKLNLCSLIPHCRLILMFCKPSGRQNQIFSPCFMKDRFQISWIRMLIILWIIHIHFPCLSCHSGLIIESALKNTERKTNKLLKTEKAWDKGAGLSKLLWSEIVTSPPFIQLHTPWWRLWSNNLLLGKVSHPLWWSLKSLGTGRCLWKALKSAVMAVWNMVKLLVVHFRLVLCRYAR